MYLGAAWDPWSREPRTRPSGTPATFIFNFYFYFAPPPSARAPFFDFRTPGQTAQLLFSHVKLEVGAASRPQLSMSTVKIKVERFALASENRKMELGLKVEASK